MVVVVRGRLAAIALVVSGLVGACAQGADQTPDGTDVGTSQNGTDPAPSPSTSSTAGAAATNQGPSSSPDDGSAKSPTLSSIQPSKATVGSVGPTIVLAGNDFVARTVVQLDGAPLTTTFVSATELRATIPTTNLAAIGTLHVSVGTSPPGGGASTALAFTVENPGPTLTTLMPLSVTAGTGDTPLTITGTGFVTGASVTVAGSKVASTIQDAQTIITTLPSAMLQTSGTLDVVVTTPAPGGGASMPLSFTVSNPAVQLTSVAPTFGYVNASATTVTVVGSGFVSTSSVLFNGNPVTTTFVDGRTLTAIFPASALTAVGDYPVAVKSPPPGGGVSVPLSFRVQYLAPQVTTATPTPITAGAGATVVTVAGSGFYPASQVLFNGAASATTYGSLTSLTATLTAAQVASAGAISVTVVTPAPGGGTSNIASISVNNPAPVITTLAPASLNVGAPDTLLTVTGAGYVSGSVIQLNGANLATTYVSATQLKATIAAAQLSAPGTLNITVLSPAPGGGTSAAKAITVGCDTTGVNVALGAVDTVTTLATSFSTATSYTRFEVSSACDATYTTTTSPGRFWVVQNTAGVTVTLSAWAACPDTTGEDDAFLTFYSGSTIPANDAARAMCTNAVSEGADGYNGYASPESGTSSWCPGLTKANGGGMTLSACQKAVVFIQPYSMTNTSYLPPPQLKLKPE
jgi:hypothetical protein